MRPSRVDKQTIVCYDPSMIDGATIKKIRTGMGMTQKQFAKALGTSDVVLRRWELGQNKPILVFREAIARIGQAGSQTSD
jgi:DNA-binding transcriptional regulator YiaG